MEKQIHRPFIMLLREAIGKIVLHVLHIVFNSMGIFFVV